MSEPTPPEYPPPPPANPAYPPPAPPGASYPPPAAPSPQYPAPPHPAQPYPQAPGYPQPTYGQQPGYGQQMPSQNWALSIIGILFFLFTGLVAVYFSSQVRTLWNRGDVAGSSKASRMARTWGIVSIVLGVLVIAYYANQGGSSTS